MISAWVVFKMVFVFSIKEFMLVKETPSASEILSKVSFIWPEVSSVCSSPPVIASQTLPTPLPTRLSPVFMISPTLLIAAVATFPYV
jgi:hypothetical protein